MRRVLRFGLRALGWLLRALVVLVVLRRSLAASRLNRTLLFIVVLAPNLAAVLCLGLVSHKQVLAALGRRQAAVPFRHGEAYDLGGFRLYDSYHCSRYNMNTGRLTTAMFAEVFGRIAADLR